MTAIPYLTSHAFQAIDEALESTYGHDISQVMETAGVGVATWVRNLAGPVSKKRITVMVGPGNNGGDAMVASLYLANWGADVTLVLTQSSAKSTLLQKQQLRCQKHPSLTVVSPDDAENILQKSDIILDGLLGFGGKGSPRPPISDMIAWANASQAPKFAIDIPSGLDADTGIPNDPCIAANACLTLGLPKKGFKAMSSQAYVGTLYLADIGLNPEQYSQAGLEETPFQSQSIISLAGEKK